MADTSSKKLNYSFGMEKMKQKDEEARLERMNTKQKRGTPTRDVGLQTKVFFWMMEVLEEQPRGKQDYDLWLSDGVAIGKVLQTVMFNSIPVDMIETPNVAGSKKASTSTTGKKTSLSESGFFEKVTEDRIKSLLKYLRKYGVPEPYLFEISELKDMTNIPKVTRCIAMLGKMAGVETFKHCTIEVPVDEENNNHHSENED